MLLSTVRVILRWSVFYLMPKHTHLLAELGGIPTETQPELVIH